MTKKSRNLNEQTMRDREDAAYNTLAARTSDWDNLRARARNRLSGLLLSREDIDLGRADHSLMLLAALWHITPRSMRTGPFPQTRIIRQFGDKTKEVVTVDKLFSPIAMRRACVVAADLEQSLLVINDHFDGLLTGPYHKAAVWRYTSLPISQAVPQFWPHIYGIMTNVLIARLASQGKSSMSREDALALLSDSVRQYFSTHGVSNYLAVADLNSIDNIVINLFMTDDLRGIDVAGIPLFRNSPSGGVNHLVRSLLETVDRNSYTDDPDVDCEEDDENIMSAFVAAESEHAADMLEIRDVFLEQDGTTLVPQTIQFRNTSKQSAFQDVEDLASIGFSICWRKQELGARNLLPRELLELSAALHEVAEFDEPSANGSMGAQPMKATRASKAKARKILSRETMINVLHNARRISRNNAINMTDDEVRDRYNDYMSRDSDI